MHAARIGLWLNLVGAALLWTTAVRAEPRTAPGAPSAESADKSAADQKSLRKGTAKELHQARHSGWLAISQIVPVLEAGDAKEFPAGAAWLADFRAATKEIDPKADPAMWPMIDVDALVTNNSNFWRAHYEIAPGDPAIVLLHGGLLFLGGEPRRASCVVAIGLQRPGIPAPVREIMETLVRQGDHTLKSSNERVQEGIKLHDAGKYAEALKQYEEALALCPQNGFAHYEWGLTFRQQAWQAAGFAPDAKTGVIINEKRLMPKQTVAAFARARKHDPFQWKAYQGDDKEILAGFRPFLDKGMRNWEKVSAANFKLVGDEVMAGLSEGLQAGHCHDLALLARQIVVARRGQYVPEDHPFLCASLRKLAPGDGTEELLKRLGGTALKMRQLVPPESKP